ncbi:sensor histidine kinase [Streptomyces hoynatensis]|uniref:histidine kinase n=2 Tax=Streptomyces hoynatensis TaxID=1141874 RepID=A0A3A9Z1W9_9ACTN|nr:sensor histidine kinase [Streptomyces hoynatensis]
MLLTVHTLVLSQALFILFLVSVGLVPIGLGLVTTPPLARAVRAHADRRRAWAQEWFGMTVPSGYRPLPVRAGGLAGQVQLTTHALRDPATWRDVQWLFADAVAGSILVMLTWTLPGYFLYGLVLLAGVWRPIVDAGGTYWYTFVPVDSWFTAFLAALVGTGLLAAAFWCNVPLLRGHFAMLRGMTGASEKQLLAQRVARLQETRHDALDSSAAELRRIERDLHDGAQARLVAMGMSLGAVEALIEKDPGQAKRLLAQARENSAEALTELRDLVRGIHPPVLAERGLGDAVRALALRMALPVDVEVDLPGRFDEPVESAAYFAVSEILTNAAKHSGAERAWVDMYYGREERTLRIAVTDNGRGGASLDGGTGLRGLERRLGAFDGVLALSSPEGGPTLVTIEIPCTPATGGGATR